MGRGRLYLTSGIGAALVCSLGAGGSASETKTYTYDALGRLVQAQSSGTVNNQDTSSICYDPAGNRTQYKSDGAGSVVNCGSGSSNNPPVTQSDSVQVGCNQTTTVNVTANDSDPDGNLPLTLISVAVNSGFASATVASASSVQVTGSFENETATATYTIQDSLGATATGILTIKSVGGPSICF